MIPPPLRGCLSRPTVLPAVFAAGITWLALAAHAGTSLVPGLTGGESQRARSLEQRRADVFRPIEAKLRMAEDVAEGRLSLTEAAARFRALGAEARASAVPRQASADVMEAGVWCREVIDYVRYVLRDQPERAALVIERLSAEMQQLRSSTFAGARAMPSGGLKSIPRPD